MKKSKILSLEGLNYHIFRYNIGGGDDPLNRHCEPHHMGRGKGLRAEMEGFKDSIGDRYHWERDAAQRKILLKIKEKRPDAIFEAFSNSCPYYMTYSGCVAGHQDGGKDNLRPEYYEAFAHYLVDVKRSPASAQGTSRLRIFPSTRYLGMRAVMYVWHCHKSRCHHVRSGWKSYIGNFFPATVTSGIEKRTLTYMLSLASFFSKDSTCQSLSAGNSREANISSIFAAMLQIYEDYLNRKHIHVLIILTNGNVNSH